MGNDLNKYKLKIILKAKLIKKTTNIYEYSKNITTTLGTGERQGTPKR